VSVLYIVVSQHKFTFTCRILYLLGPC